MNRARPTEAAEKPVPFGGRACRHGTSPCAYVCDIAPLTSMVHEVTEHARLLERLRESEARCRALLEQLACGVLFVDAAGTIRLSNPAACELLGFSATELTAKSVHDPEWDVMREDGARFPKEECPLVRALALEAPARGIVMGIVRRTRRDRVWLEVHINPQVGADGRVREVLCTFSDITARRAVEQRLQREIGSPRRHERERCGIATLVGQSPAMHPVYELIRRAAEREGAAVLLLGESGTGKEMVARAIHAESPRATGPFVAVDCGSLPPTLIESELFGHEKGAFTGATAVKRGLFEQADGGTILLDEVGDIPLDQQVKLLRVVQERAIRRVGATKEIPVDFRIVAATNRDLKREVAAGRFREDLFYRLDVLEIHLPPLRARGAEDITRLAEHFVRESRARQGRPAPRLMPDVLRQLHRYHWPGNVRELQNVVERMLVHASGDELTVKSLPAFPPARAGSVERGVARTEARRTPRNRYTKAEIEEALSRHQGNVKQTAKALGIPRTTLYGLMDKYGIRPRS